VNDRSSKYKLGKLYHTTILADNQTKYIARVIDFSRPSAYVIESFKTKINQLYSISKIDKIWLRPVNYYIDERSKVFLFYKESTSLYELLHSEKEDPKNFE